MARRQRKRQKKRNTSKVGSLLLGCCIVGLACFLMREHWPFLVGAAVFVVGTWLWTISKRLRLATELHEIDAMNGFEFEKYLTLLFKRRGCVAKNVGAGGGDFGTDIIVHFNGEKIAVQAKNYDSGKVGNDAVQQAIAGASYYGCDRAMVVTNATYTKAAIKQARGSQIIPVTLWDRARLQTMVQSNRFSFK